EMLTARPPFDGEGAQLLDAIARRDPIPVSQIRGDVSENLDRAIGWALAKAPADRFASPYAFAHALQPFACTEGRVLVDRIGRIAHARKSLIEREETPATPMSVPVVLPPPSTPSRRGARSSPPPAPQRAVPRPVSVPRPPEPPPPPPSSRTGPPPSRVSWPTPPPVSSPPPRSSTSAVTRSISSSSGGWERLPSVPPPRASQFSSMPPAPRARAHTVAVFAAGLAALPTLVLVMMMALAVPTSRSTANGGLADAGVSSAPTAAPRTSAAREVAQEMPKPKTRSAPPAPGGQFIKPAGKNAAQEEEADIDPVDEPEPAEGPGTLVVVVLGGSCALAVDGASRGVGATVTEKVPPGSHSVTCTPKGKTPKSRRVNVEPGKKAVTMFKL
ncbi:MAG TPA: hypothetical protein VFB62_14095, partial [Polyangiaceae bacterium]|nr:hypothetical protein [Polyangiaceae bacterium]